MRLVKIVCVFTLCLVTINCFIRCDQKDNVKDCTEFSLILGASSLGGIGVFAVHDIPAGTMLSYKGHNIRILKVKDIPLEFIKYCIYINDNECICPERFDRMEIGWFFNHSATPNIALNEIVLSNIDIYDGAIPAHTLYALADIKAGQEVLIDYNDLNEPEHLKESYQS